MCWQALHYVLLDEAVRTASVPIVTWICFETLAVLDRIGLDSGLNAAVRISLDCRAAHTRYHSNRALCGGVAVAETP